jgi:hypothetical protein
MFRAVILPLGSGYKVQNAAKETLGRVEELVVDPATGRIMYAVIAHGGFLNGGSRLIALPWELLRMEIDQKRFLLNIDKKALAQAPQFDRKEWPDVADPEWREHVESYFAFNVSDEKEAAESGRLMESELLSARPLRKLNAS